MKQDDRRTFLKSGAAAAAGSFLNLNPRAMGANEKVTLALIGGRNQGRLVAGRAIEAGARFKTFCDLDPAIQEKVGGEIAKQRGAKPALEKECRRVLDDKSIDAVVIATPDHWHTRHRHPRLPGGQRRLLREAAFPDVEIGRLSATLCHLGNISYKLGRDVHFDPRTETFPNDKAANELLVKSYRKPYEPPKV